MAVTARDIALDYAERVWNKKDLNAINAYVHPDVIIHSLLGDFYGINAMQGIVHAWLTGFADMKVENEDVITENDLVVTRWKSKGTHQGDFKGVQPTNRPVIYSGVTIYRVQNGKITEYWAYIDMQHLINQIKGP